MMERKKAWLLLANGKLFEGCSIGVPGTVIAEAVFSTGMTGYQEALTEPCYYGQMMVHTYPLIGNAGVNDEDNKSDHVWMRGYVVRELCERPSNFRCTGTLGDFLAKHEVVGISGVDTRAITRTLREDGVMGAMITTEYDPARKEEYLEQIRAYKIENAVAAVTGSEKAAVGEGIPTALYDFGSTMDIAAILAKYGCAVKIVPANTTAEQIRAMGVKGVVLSAGPGDPVENTAAIEEVKKIMAEGMPVFGIGLGHQIAALAQGAKTEKLKYGHRGANMPVLDKTKGHAFISSQNHGYHVVSESVTPEIGTIRFVNCNDGTCEGIEYAGGKALSIQFNPDNCGGPHDTGYLFEKFVAMMKEGGDC